MKRPAGPPPDPLPRPDGRLETDADPDMVKEGIRFVVRDAVEAVERAEWARDCAIDQAHRLQRECATLREELRVYHRAHVRA